MGECIFCEIIDGQSPASIYFEDDAVLGLMTIGPVTTGHAMVVPKRHAAFLSDLDEGTGRHIWTIAQRTAAALRASTLPCDGVNLFLADGEVAFQEVLHVHLHVFPRYKGDSFRLVADWDTKPGRDELDSAAQQINAAYRELWDK